MRKLLVVAVAVSGLAKDPPKKEAPKVPEISIETQIEVLATQLELKSAQQAHQVASEPYIARVQAAEAAAQVPMNKAMKECGEGFIVSPNLAVTDGQKRRVVCVVKPPESGARQERPKPDAVKAMESSTKPEGDAAKK